MEKVKRDILEVGILLFIPAAAAFLSGQPFIFPSLGPSAFNLILNAPQENTARRVIGGHFAGVVSGLVCYKVLASGLTLAGSPYFFSTDMLRLSVSGLASVVLTTALMLVTKTEHSPACATTLIVSLGILSTGLHCFLIMVSVVLMYGVYIYQRKMILRG